jgi:L-rhamnose isomerase
VLDRTNVGLDFFDASINRVGGYIVGTRSTQKCFMQAMLEPISELREFEANNQLFERLALLEEAKVMPWNAVWDYFCLTNNVPIGDSFIKEVQQYEKNITNNRD